MQVVVIGGAGVLGQALLKAIVARGVLTRSDGVPAPVRRVIAVDRSQPPRLFVEARVEYVRGAGHTYDEPIEARLQTAFPWLIEGDPRWK